RVRSIIGRQTTRGAFARNTRVAHGGKGGQNPAHGGRHCGNPGGNWPGFQRPIGVMGFWQRGHMGGGDGAAVVSPSKGGSSSVLGGCQARISSSDKAGFCWRRARTRLARSLAAGCNQPNKRTRQ